MCVNILTRNNPSSGIREVIFMETVRERFSVSPGGENAGWESRVLPAVADVSGQVALE